MPMTVKACLMDKDDRNKEMRRFAIDQDSSTSFECFRRKVVDVFEGLRTASFQMFYKDERGDLITFSSSNELMVGLALVKDNTFNLFIKQKKEHDPSPCEVPPPLHRPMLHPDVVCDGCDGPVVGTRFKCTVCCDYDLCSSCQGKGFHREHTLFPIFQPIEDHIREQLNTCIFPPMLHPHVTCDGCDGPVVGTRFKCTVCCDYDLCSSCQSKGFHREHTLFPIFQPIEDL